MHGGSENGQKGGREIMGPVLPPIVGQTSDICLPLPGAPSPPNSLVFVRSLPATWVIRHEMFNSSSASMTNSG